MAHNFPANSFQTFHWPMDSNITSRPRSAQINSEAERHSQHTDSEKTPKPKPEKHTHILTNLSQLGR